METWLLMATTIAKRVTAQASGGATRRVAIGGHGSDYDCWGGSWGSSWGLSWHNFFSASELSENITQRVTSTQATANNTKRVTL